MPSRRQMTVEAWGSYRNAMILLLVVWFAYPIIFGFAGYTEGGAWTTAMLVTLSVADIAAKIGFGVLIHKVAMLRTAEDVNEGIDTFPEAIWIPSTKRSDAELPGSATPAVHSARIRSVRLAIMPPRRIATVSG